MAEALIALILGLVIYGVHAIVGSRLGQLTLLSWALILCVTPSLAFMGWVVRLYWRREIRARQKDRDVLRATGRSA